MERSKPPLKTWRRSSTAELRLWRLSASCTEPGAGHCDGPALRPVQRDLQLNSLELHASGGGCPQVGEDSSDSAAQRPLLRKPEFGEDRVHILLDRGLGQMEASRDRRVRLALCHLAQHLDLAVAQQPQRRLRLLRPVVDKT